MPYSSASVLIDGSRRPVPARAGRLGVPVSHHWARTADDACPVLAGGLAAKLAYEDLWAALEPYLVLADYGEDAWRGASWRRDDFPLTRGGRLAPRAAVPRPPGCPRNSGESRRANRAPGTAPGPSARSAARGGSRSPHEET